MSKTMSFVLSPHEGEWSACVGAEGRDYSFLGEEIKSIAMKVFEAAENTGTETSQEGGRLTLGIPLVPDDFRKLEEDPTISFEVVNDFEDERMEGLKFDKWIVRGRGWERDVIAETEHSLKGQVLFSFRTPQAPEQIAA